MAARKRRPFSRGVHCRASQHGCTDGVGGRAVDAARFRRAGPASSCERHGVLPSGSEGKRLPNIPPPRPFPPTRVFFLARSVSRVPVSLTSVRGEGRPPSPFCIPSARETGRRRPADKVDDEIGVSGGVGWLSQAGTRTSGVSSPAFGVSAAEVVPTHHRSHFSCRNPVLLLLQGLRKQSCCHRAGARA